MNNNATLCFYREVKLSFWDFCVSVCLFFLKKMQLTRASLFYAPFMIGDIFCYERESLQGL